MIRYSKLASEFRSSAIRDLMSIATRPDIISFAGGMPDNELFPIEEINEIFNHLSIKQKQIAFQYGPTTGLPDLIESLGEFLEKKGLPVKKNKIIITTGSLQAINILAKVMLDAGDEILVENPCFIGALSAFKSYGAVLKGIDIDAEGLNISQLNHFVNAVNPPKFLYITPYFHNPAGITYSIKRKYELIEVLKNKNVPLIEDDAYGDLWFYEQDKERLKPIKAIDPEGIDVCYTGSFSKILGPGLRLGWMLVPEDIYRKCELVKQCFDACSPSLSQVLADAFIRSGKIYEYIDRIRPEYRNRAEAMDKALKNYMPGYVKWESPRGGFYIWLSLPKGTNATEILKKAIDNGAVFVVGQTFDPDNQKNDCLRLSYCNTSIDKIEKGIKIVANAIKSVCG
jgi:DNA-binding transcriptional MocR family regulator